MEKLMQDKKNKMRRNTTIIFKKIRRRRKIVGRNKERDNIDNNKNILAFVNKFINKKESINHLEETNQLPV